jgi:hypothetical protein
MVGRRDRRHPHHPCAELERRFERIDVEAACGVVEYNRADRLDAEVLVVGVQQFGDRGGGIIVVLDGMVEGPLWQCKSTAPFISDCTWVSVIVASQYS